MTGTQRSPWQEPVVQPVSRATSSTLRAPFAMASATRGYLIPLQMQTGLYFSRIRACFSEAGRRPRRQKSTV